MTTAVSTKFNVAWIQPDGPGTVPRQLGTCYAMDSVTIPKGSFTRNTCYDPVAGKYETTSLTQDAPDMPTATLEGLTQPQADYLEKTLRKSCPFYLYVHTTMCPPRGSFLGFDRGKVLKQIRVESEEESGVLARDQTDSMESYDLVMEDVEKYFDLAVYKHTQVAAEEALDIVFAGGPTCAGDCGPEIEECEIGYLGQAGAAAAVGIVDYTNDSGTTWQATSAVPFAVNPNLADVATLVMFPMGGHIWRLLAGAGTTWAANPPQVSYADVDIVAAPQTTVWTQVAMTGLTNADYLPWNASLFAIDQFHIWAGTDGGEIGFSADGGLTWTLQLAAIVDMIRAIKFLDTDFGVYVGGTTGASRVIGFTLDGGLNWDTTVTGTGLPAGTIMASAVTVFSKQRWLIGLENGTFYQTWDQGENWTLMPAPTYAGMTAILDINNMMKVDEVCIWAAGTATISASTEGVLFRTVNGGYNWEVFDVLDDDAAIGARGLWACSYNQAQTAGGEEGAVEVTAVVTD